MVYLQASEQQRMKRGMATGSPDASKPCDSELCSLLYVCDVCTG